MNLLSSLIRLLRDRNFILILSLILGISLYHAARYTSSIFLPILIFVMTISMTNITKDILKNPRRWIKPTALSLAINYTVLGGSMILLSYIFRLSQPYLTGFIVLAAVPPAIAVIPFTNFLGGDPDYSLVGFTACYIAAFLVTPLTLSVFIGSQPGFESKIFTLLFQLILLPFILSRLLLRFNVEERIKPYKGTLVNWSFFIIIYTIVGLNRQVFLRNPSSLIPLIVIGVLDTFILGFLIEKAAYKANINDKKVVNLVLFGTSKNSGFAAGLAITLFGAESTVPSTITTVLMLVYVIFLDLKKRKR